jgi:hypothetical protein
MTGFLITSMVLLSIALLAGALGPRNADLQQFLALVAMAPVLWLFGSGVDRRLRGAVAAFGAAAMVVVWYATSGPAQHFALAGAIGLLAFVQGSRDVVRKRLGASLALGLLTYGAFVAVRDHVTLWPVLFHLSVNVSHAVASVLRIPVRLGPTYSGLWIVSAFAAMFVSRAAVARRRLTVWSIGAIVLLVVLPAVALWLRRIAIVRIGGAFPLQFLEWRPVVFALLLVPLAIFLREQPLATEGGGVRSRRRAGAHGSAIPAERQPRTYVWAVSVLLGVLALAYAPRIPAGGGRVLLDSRGHFNLAPLVWGAYGPNIERGASLATLPSVLESKGFSVSVSDTTLSPATLASHDVLVVMNPDYQLSDEELRAVWAFVDQGGGLLVLGDHTNISGIMEPLNTLIEPTGVRYNFDSAIPRVTRWSWYDCIRVHPHPVTRGIRDETDIRLSVGASIHLPFGATPLLSGTHAFSDAGNWDNPQGAYLGNMHYDPQEPLGDIPLAAVVRHGRGAVVIFGDTSPFQRSAIFGSHEFVTRIFTFLAHPGSRQTTLTLRLIGVILLAAGIVGLLSAGASGLGAVVAAGVLGLAALLGLHWHSGVNRPPVAPGSDVVWVDVGHGNRVDLHTGEENGIGGFVDHLWRHGFVPLATRRLDEDELDRAIAFATVAPAHPFSGGERAALRQFVEDGGLLIVATGYEERNGSEGLLAEFGYSIGPTPIGAAHAARVHLGELREIYMHESWPVVFPRDSAEVWVSSWDYPLITFEMVGSGGLLVIGDSFFLCDVSQENTEQFVEPNINFLRAAIDTALARIQEEARQ